MIREASEYLEKALRAYTCRSNAKRNTHELDQQKDFLKSFKQMFTKDIQLEFEEMKRLGLLINKNRLAGQVNFDEKEIFNFYNRIAKESQLFTFTNTRLARQAAKLHKWFLLNPYYDSKCTMDSFDVNPNLNFDAKMPMKPGHFIFKSSQERSNDRVRILYLLASSSISSDANNRDQVKDSDAAQNVKSVMVNDVDCLEDKFEVGYLFISRVYMEKLNLQVKLLIDKIPNIEGGGRTEKEQQAITEEFMDVLKKLGLVFMNSTDESSNIKFEAKINSVLKKDIFMTLEPTIEILQPLLGLYSINGVSASGRLYPLLMQYHRIRYSR